MNTNLDYNACVNLSIAVVVRAIDDWKLGLYDEVYDGKHTYKDRRLIEQFFKKSPFIDILNMSENARNQTQESNCGEFIIDRLHKLEKEKIRAQL